MIPLGGWHDTDFSIDHLLDGILPFGHAEPFVIGNGLQTRQTGHWPHYRANRGLIGTPQCTRIPTKPCERKPTACWHPVCVRSWPATAMCTSLEATCCV